MRDLLTGERYVLAINITETLSRWQETAERSLVFLKNAVSATAAKE